MTLMNFTLDSLVVVIAILLCASFITTFATTIIHEVYAGKERVEQAKLAVSQRHLDIMQEHKQLQKSSGSEWDSLLKNILEQKDGK